MKKAILKKSLICGIIITLFGILKFRLEYLYRNELVFHPLTSSFFYLLQLSVPIILAYTIWKSLRNANFFDKFIYGVIAFTVSSLLLLISHVALHQYIDKDYKNTYTQHLIEKHKENIEHNSFHKATSNQAQIDLHLLKESTVQSFETKTQINNFIRISPFILLLGLVIGLSIFCSKKENSQAFNL